jgi:hypothetical protein
MARLLPIARASAFVAVVGLAYFGGCANAVRARRPDAFFVDVVDIIKNGGLVGPNPTHVSEGDHWISQRAKSATGTVTISVVI